MTNEKPPGPPAPRPQFEPYRPDSERTQGQPPQQPRPPQPPRQAPTQPPQTNAPPPASWGHRPEAPRSQPPSQTQRPAPPLNPPQRAAQQMPPPNYPPQQLPPQQRPPQQGGPRGPQGPMPPLHHGGPPGGRRPPPPRSGSNPLKWIVFGALAVAGLLAGAAALLFVAAPTGFIRDQMIAQVKAKSGRDLIIAGQTSFTFYPSIGLAMQDVTLSAPPGMAAKPFVQMKALDVAVRLMPLLQREVAVDKLVLKEPVFNFEIDKAGRKSWDFAPPGKQAAIPARIELAQAAAPSDAPTITDAPPPAATSPSSRAAAGLEQLQLNDVRIEKGIVNFADASSGATQQVSDIDMALSLPSITGSLDAKGDLVWNGENLDIAGKLTSVNDILEQRPAKLAVTMAGRPLTASYDGTLALKQPLEADGALDVQTASARSLAAWLGTALPVSNGFGPLSLKGTVRTVGPAITITGMNASLDDAKASGDISVVSGGERPNIKANLKLSHLDLNTYLAPAGTAPAKTTAPAPPPPKPASPAAPPPASGGRSIEDLLNESTGPGSPQVKGFTQRAGLSDEPLDLTVLALADAGITLDATRLTYQAIAIDRAKVTLALNNRVLKATVHDLAALGGNAKGFVTVDGSAANAASAGTNLTFEGLSIAPLLKLAGLTGVSGSGTLGGKIAMAGQGASERQIAETLSGESQLGISNGAFALASDSGTQKIEAVSVSLAAASLSSPLTAAGSLAWNGEKVGINATLSTLKELADARPVALKASLTGAPLTATYDGTLAYTGSLAANGAVAVKTPSARNLAAWFGTALPPARGFGPLEISGKVALAEKSFALTSTKFAIDGETGSGDITVNTAAARPHVRTTLRMSGLDLNKYFAEPLITSKAKSAAAAPLETSTVPGATPKPAATKVYGAAQRAGWSEEPMDLAALGLIDLDAKLSLGKLLYKKIKVGQSQLTVGLKNKLLKTNFEDVQLYQGRGKGFVSIDGAQPQIANVGANLAFDGVDSLTLLKDAADLDWLAGKGKLTLAVAGQGATQRQIVDTLAGKADLTFTDGAIVGINIPGMIRNISQGKLGGLKSAPTEKTDFSEFASTWAIQGGVAQNQDLALVSPLLRITGAGKVLLGARQLDYMMKPKLVADLTGQGGADSSAGLEIPLRITGNWEKPKFEPDVKGLLKDPNKVIDAVKEIGKQFKGKNANEILDGLLGSKKAPAEAPAADPNAPPVPAEKPSKTQQFLDKFLKQPQ